jgi:hypothetical protein
MLFGVSPEMGEKTRELDAKTEKKKTIGKVFRNKMNYFFLYSEKKNTTWKNLLTFRVFNVDFNNLRLSTYVQIATSYVLQHLVD